MPLPDEEMGPRLTAAGLKGVRGTGYGPESLWTGQINGQSYTMSQRQWADRFFGTESPYYRPPVDPTPWRGADGLMYTTRPDGTAQLVQGQGYPPAKAVAAPERIEQNGVVYERQANGEWVPAQGVPQQVPQPLRPHLYTDRNGDIVALDLTTFAERVRIPGAQWATLSPEQQRAIALGDIEAARAFTTGERVAGEQARAAETERGRAAAAHESAYDRALRAAEFAASQAQSERGLQFNVEQANRQGFAQAARDRLGAARQYADLVSSTDTAALPAYLQAGGGVLWNARQARPEGLLTANAINPAAASLRSAETIGYQPITLPPMQGFQPPPYQPWQEPRVAPVSAASSPPTGASNDINSAFYSPAAIAARVAESRAAGSGAGGGGFPGFAGGTQGFIHAPREFMTGERGPELQQVYDPPGPDNAMLRVVPGFALGTDADPQGLGIDTAGLDPYAQRVREFRRGFQGPQLDYGMFDPRFSRVYSPQVRQSYFMGQQTQSGVPAEALAWESQRFTPRGFSRGALGLSY